MKRLTILVSFLFALLFATMIPACAVGAGGGEAPSSSGGISVPFEVYRSDAYAENDVYKVGDPSFGRLHLQGAIKAPNRFHGIDAYVATDEKVNLSLWYNASKIKPYKDFLTNVAGVDLDASVHRGSATVLTKLSPTDDYTVLYSAVDILNTHALGVESLYSPGSEKLSKGVFVKVIFAIPYFRGNTVIHQLEAAEFFLKANNSPVIIDLAENDSAGILTDGSTTTEGFDLLIPKTHSLFVSFNGTPFMPDTRTTFYEAGMYQLRFFNQLDDTILETRIYVLPAHEEAFAAYFGKSMLDERSRIFTTSAYPSFKTFAAVQWNTPIHLPPLSGNVTNLDTGETKLIDYESESGNLYLPAGRWKATFSVGGSGSFYQFEQPFEVLNEGPAPSVNLYLLEEWIGRGEKLVRWRFVKVPFQSERIVAIDGATGEAHVLEYGIEIGKQLSDGEYTIKEISGNGQIYTYSITLKTDAEAAPTTARPWWIAIAIVAAVVSLGSVAATVTVLLIRKEKKHA